MIHQINWKVRFQNKTFILSFIAVVLTFIYEILAMFEIVPAIGQNKISDLLVMVVDILVMLGIITDPTTTGICDSNQAMTYEKPKQDR